MYGIRTLTMSLFASSAVGLANADSFAVNEYSASDLGRANSGRVTQTDDPAAAFGNPALLTAFERPEVSLGVSGIFGNAEYDDRGSTDAFGNPLGGECVSPQRCLGEPLFRHDRCPSFATCMCV